jgi:hypothetical protein
MKYHATFWSLMILAFCGCSKPAHLPPEVSKQLATADCVFITTNRFHASGSVITGREVSKLANAVASARLDRLPAAAIFDWDVEFYAGTNFLTVIHLQGRVFMLGEKQYVDDSGVLATFWQKLVAEDRAR